MNSFRSYRMRTHFPETSEFKLLQEEAEIFLESFNSPYPKSKIHIPDDELSDIYKNHNVSDYNEYELNDGQDSNEDKSKMIVYKRGYSYEIHHVHASGESGKMISTGKPNPRFVATMLHHAKGLIDAGHSVRIVGNEENGMFGHYHRIAKALARKHDFVLTRPVSHCKSSSNLEAHKFIEFEVSKKINESLNHNMSCTIHSGKNSGAARDIMRITTFAGGL
jgi:hypothetical protein